MQCAGIFELQAGREIAVQNVGADKAEKLQVWQLAQKRNGRYFSDCQNQLPKAGKPDQIFRHDPLDVAQLQLFQRRTCPQAAVVP